MPRTKASHYEIPPAPGPGRSGFIENSSNGHHPGRMTRIFGGFVTTVAGGVLIISGAAVIAAAKAVAVTSSDEDKQGDTEPLIFGGVAMLTCGAVGALGGTASLIYSYLAWKRDARGIAPHPPSILQAPPSREAPRELTCAGDPYILPLPLNKAIIREGWTRSEPASIYISYKEEPDDPNNNTLTVRDID